MLCRPGMFRQALWKIERNFDMPATKARTRLSALQTPYKRYSDVTFPIEKTTKHDQCSTILRGNISVWLCNGHWRDGYQTGGRDEDGFGVIAICTYFVCS